MRVLNPKVRNPLYRLYNKIDRATGDAGVLTTIFGLGIAAPVGSSIFIDSALAFGTVAGGMGLITYGRYTTKTKEKLRLDSLLDIQKRLPEGYRKLIDPFIAEVYNCTNKHVTFRMGSRYQTISRTDFGHEIIKNIDHETEKEWEQRKKHETILSLGHSCQYCGERIQAAKLLLEECQSAQIDDDGSVQTVLRVIESQREQNETIRAIRAETKIAYKELMQ